MANSDYSRDTDEGALSPKEESNKLEINGMFYGRIKERDAHMPWTELSFATIDFEEYMSDLGQDEVHQYPAPC